MLLSRMAVVTKDLAVSPWKLAGFRTPDAKRRRKRGGLAGNDAIRRMMIRAATARATCEQHKCDRREDAAETPFAYNEIFGSFDNRTVTQGAIGQSHFCHPE